MITNQRAAVSDGSMDGQISYFLNLGGGHTIGEGGGYKIEGFGCGRSYEVLPSPSTKSRDLKQDDGTDNRGGVKELKSNLPPRNNNNERASCLQHTVVFSLDTCQAVPCPYLSHQTDKL